MSNTTSTSAASISASTSPASTITASTPVNTSVKKKKRNNNKNEKELKYLDQEYKDNIPYLYPRSVGRKNPQGILACQFGFFG